MPCERLPLFSSCCCRSAPLLPPLRLLDGLRAACCAAAVASLLPLPLSSSRRSAAACARLLWPRCAALVARAAALPASLAYARASTAVAAASIRGRAAVVGGAPASLLLRVCRRAASLLACAPLRSSLVSLASSLVRRCAVAAPLAPLPRSSLLSSMRRCCSPASLPCALVAACFAAALIGARWSGSRSPALSHYYARRSSCSAALRSPALRCLDCRRSAASAPSACAPGFCCALLPCCLDCLRSSLPCCCLDCLPPAACEVVGALLLPPRWPAPGFVRSFPAFRRFNF